MLDTNSNNPKDLECGLSCNTYKYPRIDVFSCTGMECVCVWTNQKFYKKGQRFCVFFSPSNLSTHLGFDKSFFFGLFSLSALVVFFHPLCDRSTDHSTISMCKDYPFDLLRFCTTRCLTIAFQCFVSNCVKCALFLRSPLNGKTFSNKTAYKK